MADSGASPTDDQVSITVKGQNDAKYNVTILTSATVKDLKELLASEHHANLPADRQRLIYSGRVLKDNDTIASSNIKSGHTVHMVKAESNTRQNPASSSSSGGQPAAPAVPTNIAAGTGNSPLAGLTGARYAGFHGLPSMSSFGADGGVSHPLFFELMES
jgi:ubiquilin